MEKQSNRSEERKLIDFQGVFLTPISKNIDSKNLFQEGAHFRENRSARSIDLYDKNHKRVRTLSHCESLLILLWLSPYLIIHREQ